MIFLKLKGTVIEERLKECDQDACFNLLSLLIGVGVFGDEGIHLVTLTRVSECYLDSQLCVWTLDAAVAFQMMQTLSLGEYSLSSSGISFPRWKALNYLCGVYL